MCGRFTRTKTVQEVAKLFELEQPPPELEPRWNILPGSAIPTVELDGNGRRVVVPRTWMYQSQIPTFRGHPNCKGEQLMKLHKKSFAERRCVVPGDGFFEFSPATEKIKRQFYFRLKGGEMFAFPAIWREGELGKKQANMVGTVTTEPNELTASVPHDRSPVLLRLADVGRWLDPESRPEDLLELVQPFPAAEMEMWEVGPAVRHPKDHKGSECIEPLVYERTLFDASNEV